MLGFVPSGMIIEITRCSSSCSNSSSSSSSCSNSVKETFCILMLNVVSGVLDFVMERWRFKLREKFFV